MKKPLGIIISAILLSLAALGLILLAAVTAFVSVLAAHHSSSAPPMPHFFIYVFLATAVFYLVLAAWAVLTVIGILRLRQWGRYSILVIGAGIAAISLMSIFGLAATHSMLPHQPGVDPHIAQAVFITISFFEAIVAAIGIWWLVYFTRRPISELFRNPNPALAPSYNPALGTDPLAYSQYTTPAPPPPPATGFFSSPSHAPAAIKILGWLYFIIAICCLPLIFLPIPAFILGFIVPVRPSHLLYLAILLIAASIGYGLLKLKNSARLATIAFIIFGICNLALAMLPWYRAQLLQYTAQIIAMIPTFPGQPTPTYTYPAAMFVFNSLIGIAINLFVLWLLHRHRAAFTTPQQTEAI